MITILRGNCKSRILFGIWEFNLTPSRIKTPSCIFGPLTQKKTLGPFCLNSIFKLKMVVAILPGNNWKPFAYIQKCLYLRAIVMEHHLKINVTSEFLAPWQGRSLEFMLVCTSLCMSVTSFSQILFITFMKIFAQW